MTRGSAPREELGRSPFRDTTGYGQRAGGTHLTGMHSCFKNNVRFNVTVLQCSATCGKGVKKRAVRCIASRGLALSDGECNAASRPHEEATCYLPACETTTIYTTATTSISSSSSVTHDQSTIQWRTGSWTPVSIMHTLLRTQYQSIYQWD